MGYGGLLLVGLAIGAVGWVGLEGWPPDPPNPLPYLHLCYRALACTRTFVPFDLCVMIPTPSVKRTFSNFSCMFLNPNIFFQFKF